MIRKYLHLKAWFVYNILFNLIRGHAIQLKSFIIVILFSFIFISDVTCGNKNKDTLNQELYELVLIQAKYGNNSQGAPALHYAVYQGDTRAVDLLLKYGASPFSLDAKQANCLFYAVKGGSVDMVKKFIDYGVNINDFCGFHPCQGCGISGAIIMNQPEVTKFLAAYGIYDQRELSHAIVGVIYAKFNFAQKKEIIQLLIANGADINCVVNGHRPLWHADGELQDFLKSLGAVW